MAGNRKKAKARPIMVQGTMSSAGKSLLAAGLCRIFTQDGYRVAPFKAQNMALNSFVTEDGLEMGRAQVMQAEAAKREPDVRMNPVLLKPTGDTGSQVIVNGEVAGDMTAAEYYGHKRQIVPAIRAAYESLAGENDVVVLEGAGSPAEINLKENDIVNMFMAKLARAPVLLAGDIDRGGVFASLYGTVMLLPEDERALIKGVVVNKFRGDAALLRPGLDMLENLIRIPVLGVVPYLRLDLDDEDSLSDRLSAAPGRELLDIAVVRLPRISNFTDFGAFGLIEQASVRYVDSPRSLGEPDLLILPGTKNTMGDLKWLRSCGLAAAILRYAAGGGPLVGICGGYQMLCRRLRDPEAVEEGGEAEGLGLLDAETVFEPRKVRTRVRGRLLAPGGALKELAGAEFTGYEIHMGRTSGASSPLAELLPLHGAAKTDGMACGSVYGCYVHGLFDSAAVLRALGRALLRRKGLGGEVALRAEDLRAYKQGQYDLLADALRAALDMRAVYRILEEGVS